MPRLTPRYAERKSVTAPMMRDCEALYGFPPPELLREAPNLQWLHLPAAGVEPYGDLSLYANRSVTLTNAGGVYGAVIAEHTLGLALALLRQLPFFIRQQAEGCWKRRPDMFELSGSTVLVCGMGDLGRNVADRFRAMGCELLGIRKVIHDIPPGFAEVYSLPRLTEAVRHADFVINCLPSTNQTRGVFDAAVFQNMRPSAFFINVGRGSAVVEADLTAALQNGVLAGAALDVFDPEPLAPGNPLWAMENVIVTPHCAGASPLNHDRNFELFFDLLTRYAAKKRLYNIVDFFAGY